MDLRNSKILKLMIFPFFLLISLLSAESVSYAQDKPSVSQGDLKFYVDYALFVDQKEGSFAEFYFMFYADQIKLSGLESNTGMVSITATIKKNDESISAEFWEMNVQSTDQGLQLYTKAYYDQWKYSFGPGFYDVVFEAEDILTGKKGIALVSFNVAETKTEGLRGSDIEFVKSVKPAKDSPQFIKGNKSIIPNPSRRFGVLNPSLYVYYEIYSDAFSNRSDIEVSYSVKEKTGDKVAYSESSVIKLPDNTAGIIHGIDVSTFTTGIYTLRINAKEKDGESSFSISRDFEIIQPDFLNRNAYLTEEEAGIYSVILSYIAPAQQLKIYESLNLKAKSDFLVEFWKSMDPDPGTSDNAFLKEIHNRFNYAKRNFGWAGIKGWETDMGRICIKYGIPHQVKQYNSEASTAPYQIWQYNEGKTYEFVFGDLKMNGRYILLHSDKEQEIYNSRWRELIQRM